MLLFLQNTQDPDERSTPTVGERSVADTADVAETRVRPDRTLVPGPAQRDESAQDSRIVAEALAGSQAAYRELVERYQRPVYSLIFRMVRDPGKAEDLTQEAFLKAFRALESYEPERKFSSWLFKIAHNNTVDLLRRKQLEMIDLDAPSEEQLPLQERLADENCVSPLARAEASDLSQAMEDVVAELKPIYREVILLRYSQGLAYQEIAEILELNIGTVKTHIHRARKVMMKALQKRGFGAETDREANP